jgi:hypothetical protein
MSPAKPAGLRPDSHRAILISRLLPILLIHKGLCAGSKIPFPVLGKKSNFSEGPLRSGKRRARTPGQPCFMHAVPQSATLLNEVPQD